jgi:hypothetical protein
MRNVVGISALQGGEDVKRILGVIPVPTEYLAK